MVWNAERSIWHRECQYHAMCATTREQIHMSLIFLRITRHKLIPKVILKMTRKNGHISDLG